MVANMVLVEAKHCAAQGLKPVVIITTSDTLIENPSIEQHYRTEHRKMREFAKQGGFKLRTEVVQPSMLMSFQLKILTGRGIPTFPGAGSDCSYDLKINLAQPTTLSAFKLNSSTASNRESFDSFLP